MPQRARISSWDYAFMYISLVRVMNEDEIMDDTSEDKQQIPRNETDPFGDEGNAEVKYRVMSWWQCGMMMITQNIPYILTFSVLMNELTNHGACTIAFGTIGLVVSFLGALPRTMDKVYWLSVASFSSILVATILTMVAIAVQNPAPSQVAITTRVDFPDAFLAVTNIIFAYIAHVAFFGYISEMEDHHEYPKSLAMLQVTDTCMYIVAAVVIYYYGEPDVASPAPSSAGPIMKKVAYGLAIPTVIFSGVVVGHVAVACKYVYVRVFRGSSELHSRGFLSIGVWAIIGLAVWVIAWVIAESIPVFNNLLSLISAQFGSWFSYGLPAIFWLALNKDVFFSSYRKAFLTFINILILGIACTICGLGLYASGKSINESSKSNSWTCANNAG